MIEFNYVGELYSCKSEVLRAASHSLDGPPAASVASSSSGVAAASAPAPVEATFVWEKLNSGSLSTWRAKLPGGWLVAIGEGATRGIAFYSDASHTWDGRTLPL
jgi:hypothetical protein